MRRITAVTAAGTTNLIVLAGALFGAAALQAASAPAADSFPRFHEAERQFGFLEENCMECHNSEDWAGSLAFDLMAPEAVDDNVGVWEEVVRKLRGRLMPPAGQERPSNPDTDRFVAWLEDYLDHAAGLERHVGHVGLHRLNRKEYANAVRDLLGIEVDASTLLPADPTVEGFDNVAAALRVSPTFIDQSLGAARVVAEQAIGDPAPRPGGATYRPENSGSQHRHVDGLPLGTRGGFAFEHYFPADGEYLINIGDLAQALWVFNQEFTHTLIATYDGERFFEMEIGGGEDLRAIDQVGDPAVDAINARLKNIRFVAEAGPHEIAVTFVQRSFAEYEGRLFTQGPIDGENVIRIGAVEVQGPFNPAGLSPTPARNRIFVCYPENAAQESPCAREIIGKMARKAFRGPVSEAEMATLSGVYARARDEGASFDLGIRRALTAVLASPRFLYRVESIPGHAEPGDIFELSDLELASRLSFFLWSSIPDEELLDLAETGRLQEPEILEAQVIRMLENPRAETLASNFAYQWLNVGGLDDIDPDPAIFRDVDNGIRDLFKEELRLFVGDVFLNNRNVVDLLTADWTYMNERLAVHYDHNEVRGDEFRKVTLSNPARHGLLGKGGVLMVSAYPDRTSPVLRGSYILEHITGTPPAPPPPNVEALQENKPGEKQLTVRERMERHRRNPTCNGCHGLMDPLGFALESFDAVGRYRSVDRQIGSPIDTSGVLPDGTPLAGPLDLRAALLERPGQFVQNLTEKLMLYALGRPVEAEDVPAVRGIVDAARENDFRFYDLVMGIVASDQFRYKQAPVPEQEEQQLASAGTAGAEPNVIPRLDRGNQATEVD